VGCFSLHPLKNLNAIGDGGFLITKDLGIATRVKRLRNHGLVDRITVERFGHVSRLDALKALVVRHRLRLLPEVIEKRRKNAGRYSRQLDTSRVFFPATDAHRFDTYHTFVVQLRNRDHVQRKLAEAGIGTSIHYPIPIHLQPAAVNLGHAKGSFPVTERQASMILSLPINQFMSEVEIDRVAEVVNREAAPL
jgi:dTDP-4-amino-4,6-dideoxygalactose transaminase